MMTFATLHMLLVGAPTPEKIEGVLPETHSFLMPIFGKYIL